MFSRLRFDTFVGGNDEQNQIDSTDPREHVADEALVAGNVDEAETQAVAVRPGQFHVSKTEVDGDSTAFFFSQAVGIDSGQSLDQSGFPMIDMAGCSNND